VPSVLVTWTAHPARRRPRDVALAVAVIATTMGVVLMSFESALLTVVAGVVLVSSIAPFLFPTRYTVTEDGVAAERIFRRRERRFADLRRLDVGDRAALLSPFRAPSWLDRQRGLLVFFDGADRDEVLRILRSKIHP
jgi:hypothetical protein